MSAMQDETRDIGWIREMLPHRYPFLLIDRVLELVPKERVVALKNVTANEPFFNGHFPDRPVMPGVLLVEAMAQAGGALLLASVAEQDRKLMYLMSIERARFRRPVVPGDQVRFEVEVLRLRSSHAKLSGTAWVDGEVAAEATVSTAMVAP
ncbi:MAG: 3-hydroxyacyl-ACP dehydratase FabZ [Thermoanaerobaculia bacterium]|nr:3-hydroxyacyl-ACP dehydratase FabZ [Thermoanaerobaculia bacterium]